MGSKKARARWKMMRSNTPRRPWNSPKVKVDGPRPTKPTLLQRLRARKADQSCFEAADINMH